MSEKKVTFIETKNDIWLKISYEDYKKYRPIWFKTREIFVNGKWINDGAEVTTHFESLTIANIHTILCELIKDGWVVDEKGLAFMKAEEERIQKYLDERAKKEAERKQMAKEINTVWWCNKYDCRTTATCYEKCSYALKHGLACKPQRLSI